MPRMSMTGLWFWATLDWCDLVNVEARTFCQNGFCCDVEHWWPPNGYYDATMMMLGKRIYLHAGLGVSSNDVHDIRVGLAEGLVVGDEELHNED